MTEHVPVLREEVLAALAVKDDGRYLDATFGRGGHATAILERLGAGGVRAGILVPYPRHLGADQSRDRERFGACAGFRDADPKKANYLIRFLGKLKKQPYICTPRLPNLICKPLEIKNIFDYNRCANQVCDFT